jgi:RNase P subunit RPR2
LIYARQAIKFTFKRRETLEGSVESKLIKRGKAMVYWMKMKDAKPVRCQKCGKPLGYVTVLAEGLRFQQPIQNVKVVAICMECFQKK